MKSEKSDNWSEYSEPMLAEEDYDYRPLISNDADCIKCKHGKMKYYHCVMGSYRDHFKSILCEAGKVPVCRNGFIKKEEMTV